MQIKAKDQYRLFWEDGTGITLYIGRKNPEALPFNLPVRSFAPARARSRTARAIACLSAVDDGFVYEMNRGTSFDGAAIDSYIRFPFTAAGSPCSTLAG